MPRSLCTPTGFSKKYLVKKVPAYIFSEVETFRFDEQTTMGRRDRRSGSQTATASKGKDSNIVDVAWGEPYAGTLGSLLAPTLFIASTLDAFAQICSLQTCMQTARSAGIWRYVAWRSSLNSSDITAV